MGRTLRHGGEARHPAGMSDDAPEFISRYEALGMPAPEPGTMCPDQCEGTGVVPVARDDAEEPWATLWREAEAKAPADDGWHFVRCPTCQGTGKRAASPEPEAST